MSTIFYFLNIHFQDVKMFLNEKMNYYMQRSWKSSSQTSISYELTQHVNGKRMCSSHVYLICNELLIVPHPKSVRCTIPL